MRLGEFIRDQREKAGLSRAAVAKAVNLNHNTILNLESNQPIRIQNFRSICIKALKLDEEQWKTALTLWVREMLGEDFDLYALPEVAAHMHAHERGKVDAAQEECLAVFGRLDESSRAEILKAMSRPEMIESIRALNTLYDSLQSQKS